MTGFLGLLFERCDRNLIVKMDSPMKKRKTNITRKSLQHFDYHGNENGKERYTCKTCGHKINGNTKWNLSSHLKTHPDIYSEVMKVDTSIDFERLKLLLNFVELVTINGRPLKAITDSAIISMNEQKLAELEAAGKGVNLRDPHLPEVKEILRNVARKIRKQIRFETEKRLISLLVDIVSKRGRSILGVSIQYIFDKQLVTRCIGMIDLTESHTGIYLADLITRRFSELGIDLEQIISITTDNGKNVLKMVRDIEEHLRKAVNDAKNAENLMPPTPTKSNIQNDLCNDDTIDRDIERILAEPEDMSSDEILDVLFSSYDIPTETVESEDNSIQNAQTLLCAISSNLASKHDLNVVWDITGINCSAHTLQLAVNDSIKAMPIVHQNIITLTRYVAKFLRRETTKISLKDNEMLQAYKKPRLDVETRWCSTYLMVSDMNTFRLNFSFLRFQYSSSGVLCIKMCIFCSLFFLQLMDIYECKSVVEYLKDKYIGKTKFRMFKLLLQKWYILKELIIILQVPYKATVALQSHRLTLSDAYGIWLKLKIHLQTFCLRKSFKTNLAKHMFDKYNERKKVIFDNPAMACALYLDPRFRCEIMHDEQMKEQNKKKSKTVAIKSLASYKLYSSQ